MATLGDCWLWAGSINPRTGYVALYDRVNNGSRGAHQVIYEALVGPVPNGFMLDHLCRQKLCVNPTHLEPVTNAINQRRGNAAKLDQEKVMTIRAYKIVGKSQSWIAKKMGVNQSTVSRIVNNKRWVS